MKRLSLLTFFFICSINVSGEVLYSSAAKIVSIQSYAEYGGGDLIFTIDPVDNPCIGYYIKKDDPGFDANVSMLLASYHSKSTIQIRAHDNADWQGSKSKYCHLYSVKYL